MSIQVKELSINSTDNIHTLIGKIYIPDGDIKGLIHIVHGMTEHIERYDYFMSKLAENGYLAFGFDNLGHGKTASSDAELGFISSIDGWKYLVNDVAFVSKTIKNMYPSLPLCLFGHSMGSFIVRIAAENNPELYDKLIICGTSGKNHFSKMGLILANVIKKIKGERYISDFIINTAFGSYNKRFEKNNKYAWLTKDSNVIAKYSKDKFCTFKFTVSAMHDLVKLIDVCNQNKWYKSINKNMPILLISGSHDPVGNYSKGVLQVHKKLLKNSCRSNIKIYNGFRHEILNDSCREEVISDILKFIK